jgi:hypothetical protein
MDKTDSRANRKVPLRSSQPEIEGLLLDYLYPARDDLRSVVSALSTALLINEA